MGFMMADRPITSMVLTMVLPITLASTISSFPDSRPWNEINSSGALVPKATMVSEMIILGIFKFKDVEAMPSTKRSAPFIKRMKPMTTDNM